MLRRKPFDQFSEKELAAMERLLARLALSRHAQEPARVATTLRGEVDLRRSFRSALRATAISSSSRAAPARSRDEPRRLVRHHGFHGVYARVLLAFAFARAA